MRAAPILTALLPLLPIVAAQLNTKAIAHGKKYFGSATDNPEMTDQSYLAMLCNTSEFGQITPGNSMKWDATEPVQGTFTFANGDAVFNFAKNNGQLIRGHNLVWYSQLPSWVSSSGFTAAELTSVITNHITELVTHYKSDIYAWDVVNEPFNDDGTYRTSVFYNTLGQDYISIALRAARAADPAAKLYLNEYNLEYPGAKFEAMLALVKSLLASGVPIDGVGFQAHLIVSQVPTSLRNNMAAFTALGIEVAITELDVRMPLVVTPALLTQQQADYKYVVGACITLTGCVGVTVWDYTDKYSWIPSVFPGYGCASPFDADLVKKPAYDGALAALSTRYGAKKHKSSHHQ